MIRALLNPATETGSIKFLGEYLAVSIIHSGADVESDKRISSKFVASI